ncbi:hypothetical protein Krac_8637 [Ktedonobacter racemifer DSM 44963]|uniref:Uncharacterized protein n=1 Tax=Ktedonobacter racemifer DSM 44963 TaxID=485913 RepID=D6TNH5_KTERA|nr:hypothetical protein Krac_8637 [Ktedonobacter racemifer DSM 44963]
MYLPGTGQWAFLVWTKSQSITQLTGSVRQEANISYWHLQVLHCWSQAENQCDNFFGERII